MQYIVNRTNKSTPVPTLDHARYRGVISLVLILIVIMAVDIWDYHVTFKNENDKIRDALGRNIDNHAVNLELDFARYGFITTSVALNGDVNTYLASPRDKVAQLNINHYLNHLNANIKTLRIFLTDSIGNIIAASDAGNKDTLIGQKIARRSYFKYARFGHIFQFYGSGTADDVSGYYLATEVENNSQRTGVVVIKIDFEKIAERWKSNEYPIFMYDHNGVIISSSEPKWTFDMIKTINPASVKSILESGQYNQHSLLPLLWVRERQLSDDMELVNIKGNEFIALTRYVPAISMSLTALYPLAGLDRLLWTRIIAVTCLLAFVIICIYLLNQRRLLIRQQFNAQEALKHAYDNLEILVEQRNHELRFKNNELNREIKERIQSEQHLKNFQKELIHTENLAVIGQLSAGLAHEINQPLAALSILSANAIRFLARKDSASVSFNLERIEELVARIGLLTTRLRSFVHYSDDALQAVSITACIDNALLLLGHRLVEHHISCERLEPGTPLYALCNAARFEQVLVNLINNAIDATQKLAAPRIIIRWRLKDHRALIQISDNGTGLSESACQKLFQPFFTTKKASGLGLGLVISKDIINSFKGSLTADNLLSGGAIFTICLAAARREDLQEITIG